MMTATSRRELYKLREVVHFLLHCDLRHNLAVGPHETFDGTAALPAAHHIVCYFCRKPLGTNTDFVEHGNAVGPKFAEKISIHHVNGDHDDNTDGNKALAHRSCHKAHHRREANMQRELEKQIAASEGAADSD